MRQGAVAWGAGQLLRMRKVVAPASSCLAQNVAGLSEQGWNVDNGERVGAGDHQNVSGLHSGERLAGPQHRQGTFQAAQIEGLFRHLKGSRGSQK
jgi:hypothetical protein